MKPPKIASLAAHLEMRRAIADARHATHARGAVVLGLAERAHEARSLDVEILDLERVIARISETQEPEHHRIQFGRFKYDLVISDRKQLGQLVAVLKTWRAALLGTDGEARVALMQRLATELTTVGSKATGASPAPEPVTPNGRSLAIRWGHE